jgi:hypothetical protein
MTRKNYWGDCVSQKVFKINEIGFTLNKVITMMLISRAY